MAAFRRLFFAALCAGLLAGVVATVAHQLGTVPIILKAEAYEAAAPRPPAQTHSPAHSHDDAAAHATAAAAWSPGDGAERLAYTLLADLLTGIAFALLLAAGLALRGGEISWREGVFWGLGGFAAFALAPGLGLPPEIPGTEAAPLLARQLWWLTTAAATGCGLALLAFTRRAAWIVLAAMLIAAPHLYGAPQPAEYISAAPAALARQFVVAVTIASFLFWIVLGAATGYFYRRFMPRASY
jgi:cobalt transporter subunit CbtA